MKIVFLDTETVGALPELHALKNLGNVVFYDFTKKEEVAERIKEAEVVITNKVVLDRKIIHSSPALKLICVAATGTNNIDLHAAAEKNIQVKNVKGYSTDSVAQHTFSLVLQLLNNTDYYDRYVKSGEYSKSRIFTNLSREIVEIKGMVFGIIGLGAIGQKVAEIAKAFGAEVMYYSTSGKNSNKHYRQVTLSDLLLDSDIVSIHAPLNEHTRDLIDHEEIRKMKSSAFLINTGRGGIIKEDDLAKALKENVIAGAALDVFEEEPIPADCPLLKIKDHPRLILTPHIAWSSREARAELLNQIKKNIEEFQKEVL